MTSVKGLLLCALLLTSAAWPMASSRDGTSVFVEVLDAAGQPLADIPVSLLSVDATGHAERRASGRTGPAGEPAELWPRRAFFELPRLPFPPRRLARVDLPTDPLAGVELPDTLAAGDRVRLQLAPDALACAGNFELRVVDDRGEPVANVPVRLEPTHWEDLILEDTTDAEGVLRIPRRELARFRERIPFEWRETCEIDVVVPAMAASGAPSRLQLPPPRAGAVTARLAPHAWLRVCLRTPAGAAVDSFHARPLRWSSAADPSDDWSREQRCTPLGDSCHLLGPIPLGERVRAAFSPGALAQPELHEFPPLEREGEVRDVTLTVDTRGDRPLQGELPRPRAEAPAHATQAWRVSGRVRDERGEPVVGGSVRIEGPYQTDPRKRVSVQQTLGPDALFEFDVPGHLDRVALELISDLGVLVERTVERHEAAPLEVVVPRPGSIAVSARLPPGLPPSQVLVTLDVNSRETSRTPDSDGELVFENVAPGEASVTLELVDFPQFPLCSVTGVVVESMQVARDTHLTDIDLGALTTSMQLQLGDSHGDTASGSRIAVTPLMDGRDWWFGSAIRADTQGRCELVVPANASWITVSAEGFEPVVLPVRAGTQHVPLIPR